MAELNVANRTLFHGDNLPFLRGINSGSVHLIATDPPFNKNKDFHATPDSLASGAQFQDRWSWRDDIHDDWLIQIQRDEPEVWSVITTAKMVYGNDMGAFLCWLGVRLLEMHRILTDDGSLYLHIDDTAQAYAKALLDAIFGCEQFRSEIVWQRTTAHNDAKRYGANTDRILFYTKGQEWTWHPQLMPHDDAYKRRFRFEDDDGRQWSDDNLTAKGLTGGGYEYEYKGTRSLWRVPLETMKQLDSKGRLHFTKNGGIRRKRYLDETGGRALQALWTDIHPINSQAKERTGYPTQKPLALYERIIKASSNPGEVVLDPFCGCATTPVAAERLGRKWIGMDIWEGSSKIIRKRMRSAGFDLGVSPRLPSGRRITIAKKPPTRTDEGEVAALVLQTPTGRFATRHPAPRSQHWRLLLDVGAFCQGCGRDYSVDPRVLEVDHVSPKSDGGSDAYENLTLLCPPCNKEKRDKITLTGLQERNRKNGHLLAQNEGHISRGRRPAQTQRRRR